MRDRVLVRHFLHRFLDHDLISPQADRHETAAIVGAAFASMSLFLSVLLAVKYQFNMYLPPGLTAVYSLDDRFLLIALGMLLVSLVALAQWDALALDSRDTVILGVLPIPPGAIVRAKFAAVALLGSGFVLAWTLPSTVLRAAALPVKLPVPAADVAMLVVAHGATSALAGTFAFLAVLGLRETLRALLGQRGFDRVSAAVQAVLIVAALSTILLLPSMYSDVAKRWLSQRAEPWWAMPPLWFVGLHEWLTGPSFDRLPRRAASPMIVAAEREATALYRSISPRFPELATVAVVALLTLLVIAVAATALNARRLPLDLPARPVNRDRWRWGRLLVTRLTARRPAARAGFFLALQAISRNSSHRIVLAAALAVGLAAALAMTGGHLWMPPAARSEMPLSTLAAQTVIVIAVASGLRRAVAIPVELRANWMLQLCWRGDFSGYVRGVQWAGITAVLAPVVFALFILHGLGTGWRPAAAHALVGFCVARLVLEIGFLGVSTLPFASGYHPVANLAGKGVALTIVTLFAAFGVAVAERTAAADVSSQVMLITTVSAVWFCVALWVDRRQGGHDDPPEFIEQPDYETQRLDLSG